MRVLRMDMDTTSRKGMHARILDTFRRGEADILVGTQMVTKGLDFGRVTVVGVISADITLRLPDFRASERTFQLLTQVAGRSGRRKTGRVVVQTFRPESDAIRHAKSHDFKSFYQEEIDTRRELNYPPFARLVLIVIRSQNEQKAIDHADLFCDILKQTLGREHWTKSQIDILGPAQAPIRKIRNFHRWHILIKINKAADRSGSRFQSVIRKVIKNYNDQHRQPAVRVSIEVDPYSLL